MSVQLIETEQNGVKVTDDNFKYDFANENWQVWDFF